MRFLLERLNNSKLEECWYISIEFTLFIKGPFINSNSSQSSLDGIKSITHVSLEESIRVWRSVKLFGINSTRCYCILLMYSAFDD